MTFEIVSRGTYLEGLAIDHDREDIWYSDVIAGGIHRLSTDSTTASFNPDRKWTGGILMNADGTVLSSGPGGIAWTNPTNGTTGWLINKIDGTPIGGVNEMIPDGDGGLYFGTVDIPAIERGEAPGSACLYHLDASLALRCLVRDLIFSNGMMLSPDASTLYHCESFRGVSAYAVGADHSLGPARFLLAKEDCDGMAVAADGTLWITGFRSGFITRLAPDGRELPPFDTPASAITQIRFGGADGRDIYFTEVPADAGDRLAEGEAPSAQVSALWRGRAEVSGLIIKPTQFGLG